MDPVPDGTLSAETSSAIFAALVQSTSETAGLEIQDLQMKHENRLKVEVSFGIQIKNNMRQIVITLGNISQRLTGHKAILSNEPTSNPHGLRWVVLAVDRSSVPLTAMEDEAGKRWQWLKAEIEQLHSLCRREGYDLIASILDIGSFHDFSIPYAGRAHKPYGACHRAHPLVPPYGRSKEQQWESWLFSTSAIDTFPSPFATGNKGAFLRNRVGDQLQVASASIIPPTVVATGREDTQRMIAESLRAWDRTKSKRHPLKTRSFLAIVRGYVALIRFCYILILLGTLTVIGSLIPALWRSIGSNDISGGFSIAQYILGVGMLVVGCATAIHVKTCTCWLPGSAQRHIASLDRERAIELEQSHIT